MPIKSKIKTDIKYQIRKNLRQAIGEQLNLTIEFVDMLPQIPGEKFRSVVSMIEDKA
jgi:hypothetical protein